MPISNVYDIYNQVQLQDKPFVDQIVAKIFLQIEAKIAENVNTFVYNTETVLVGLDKPQVGRIVDRVIATMREKGIRCGIDGQPKFAEVLGLPIKLLLWWPMRDTREYMKTYC